MKPQDQYLLDKGETFDEKDSLLEIYDRQEDKLAQRDINYCLVVAEKKICKLYDLHHIYSTNCEFFPIIELGEIEDMDKKCTTN